MPCPRWNSNGIPSLANIGKWRKPAESGRVRWLYKPVRGGKCRCCPRPQSPVQSPHTSCRNHRTAHRTHAGFGDRLGPTGSIERHLSQRQPFDLSGDASQRARDRLLCQRPERAGLALQSLSRSAASQHRLGIAPTRPQWFQAIVQICAGLCL